MLRKLVPVSRKLCTVNQDVAVTLDDIRSEVRLEQSYCTHRLLHVSRDRILENV